MLSDDDKICFIIIYYPIALEFECSNLRWINKASKGEPFFVLFK